MPPWAQTLCERLTGVRLIRSTRTSNSASCMPAARPANPPPTIITRCFAIALSICLGAVRRQRRVLVCVALRLALRTNGGDRFAWLGVSGLRLLFVRVDLGAFFFFELQELLFLRG